MPFKKVNIISNIKIADNIYKMVVPCTDEIWPGQFYMLKSPRGSTLLPRAISVCDYRDGILEFAYQVVGKGTAELAAMREGDALNMTGPLGNGFPVNDLRGRAALVSGGIGIAPMLLTAKKLAENGVSVTCLCGFRDEIFLVDELSKIPVKTLIATESGRVGTRGFVTSVLKPEDYDCVLCCGPEPMMKAVTKMCAEKAVPVFVSLENKMACGVGGCLVCTCSDKNGRNLRVCKDGPVFRGEEINFDA